MMQAFVGVTAGKRRPWIIAGRVPAHRGGGRGGLSLAALGRLGAGGHHGRVRHAGAAEGAARERGSRRRRAAHPSHRTGRGRRADRRADVVWDSVHLRGPSTIGHDCIIGEKTYVAYGVEIGNFVKINAMVYIPTGITIADRVMIAAGVIFTNDRYPRAFDGRRRGARQLGARPRTRCAAAWSRAPPSVPARASVPGSTIGAYAMVGMGAVVTADVPAHALVTGNPARIRGWVCVCGRPLPSSDADERARVRRCGRRFGWAEEEDGGMVQCHD